jgi:hypothetical protein
MMVAMAPVLTGSDRDNSRALSGSLPSLVPRFPGGNLEVCLVEIRVSRDAGWQVQVHRSPVLGCRSAGCRAASVGRVGGVVSRSVDSLRDGGLTPLPHDRRHWCRKRSRSKARSLALLERHKPHTLVHVAHEMAIRVGHGDGNSLHRAIRFW